MTVHSHAVSFSMFDWQRTTHAPAVFPAQTPGLLVLLGRLKDRHDAQVKSMLDNGPFGFIILGGSHDLSESVQRLGGGRCEYIRVTTRKYKEFAE